MQALETPVSIEIEGVRENNLKNIDVKFPHNRLTVVTGVSGSGKSSLVFDVLCQEGQRMYWKALGRVADGLMRPDYDKISGLSPVISVSQVNLNHNPRSTVGTFTEIYTYLRLLYTAIGTRFCTNCHTRYSYLQFRKSPQVPYEDQVGKYVTYKCHKCGHVIPDVTMAHFSFNTIQGACSSCSGLGETVEPIVESVFDLTLSIRQGGILTWRKGFWRHYGPILVKACAHFDIPFNDTDLDHPIGQLSEQVILLLLYGTDDIRVRRLKPDIAPPETAHDGRYEGILPGLIRRYYEKATDSGLNNEYSRFLRNTTCPVCKGKRLKKDVLEILVNDTPINDLTCLSIESFKNWIESLECALSVQEWEAVRPICDDIAERTESLLEVGLGYLNLDRNFTSLSGGEAQRLRLAALLKSNLTGMVYVFDEPTSGLHPQDTLRLITALGALRDQGNTVIVIEHDLDVVRNADYVVEIGPDAGDWGGQVVASGSLNDILSSHSLTAQYIADGQRPLDHEYAPSKPQRGFLSVHNAKARNLKCVDVQFPLGSMTAVTGVSGAGKSSLVFDCLVAGLEGKLEDKLGRISGAEFVKKWIVVDQDTMGRISRSNAATYTGAFDLIRTVFARQAAQQNLHLNSSHFSFNVPGGRCEACEGTGQIKMQMHFMPSRAIVCPSCSGKRFNDTVLSVYYNNMNIADVLRMSIQAASDLFEGERRIHSILKCLCDVGLGYLRLGQPASTLSGGEAQRIKLAAELASPTRGHTLYILDEPTVGLHPKDVKNLCDVLHGLVSKENTVIVIEHNPILISQCDWIVEIGPEGGGNGGQLIASGNIDDIRACTKSITGRYI